MKLKQLVIYPRRKSTYSKDAFYKSKQWRDFRNNYIATHPLCVICERQGRVTEATVLDHIVPRNQGGLNFADWNLQSLCQSCHQSKSASERDT